MFGFIKKYRIIFKLYCGVKKGDAGKFEESLKCFDDVLKIDPNCVKAIEFKGVLCEKNEKYDEALKYYELSTKVNPTNSKGWVGKGKLLSRLERYDEAIQWYDKSLEIKKMI